jgi:flagellar hook-length control protein FliK
MLQTTHAIKTPVPGLATALEAKDKLGGLSGLSTLSRSTDKSASFADVFSTMHSPEMPELVELAGGSSLLPANPMLANADDMSAATSLTQKASHSAVLAQLGLANPDEALNADIKADVNVMLNQDVSALTRPGDRELPGLVTQVDSVAKLQSQSEAGQLKVANKVPLPGLVTQVNSVAKLPSQSEAGQLKGANEVPLPGLVTSVTPVDDVTKSQHDQVSPLSIAGSVVEVLPQDLLSTSPQLPAVQLNVVVESGLASDLSNGSISAVTSDLAALPVVNQVLGQAVSQSAAQVAGPVVTQSAFAATLAPNAAAGAGAPNANVVTQWGVQAGGQGDAANGQAGFSHQGQSGQSNPGQGSPGQPNPQAMLNMAHAAQAQKAETLEQQAATFKLSEATLGKSAQGELLTGADFATSERRGLLPAALQTIAHPVKHPQWGQALGQRVVFMANNSISQAQITLNPEKLGPMQLTLHFDKEQQLHVTMTAQSGATRESMENAMPRLKEMLEQAGIDLGSVNVGDERQFSEQFSGDSSAKNSSPGLVKGADGEVDESAVLPNVTSDNLVDYYA